ncbi:MAG TPA: electron transport complex subunit E [Candidatus Avimonas sp.]|jgi:electron transport complex protein RnfE|nr:electron transport complex subunit E [Clostridiales bacterium]HOB36123.1 electron transport complex subunit E [Candidatus Avimonas sp.]HQA16448.1 electron transport complex subunit E [Candidatus Avimonas sp.]HQD37497.1 electron transport complex subunit E [Candidatus Avimonas sp.]
MTAADYKKTFMNGLLKENPILRLVLGTCPTLAITTAAINGLGMGAATTFVLVCSNIVISLLRRVIPDKVRLPAFIVVIAGFTTIVQMLVKAYLPAIDNALGIYLPLITVNCIILGRAEAFASRNSVGLSAMDGLGMGAGFTAALTLMGGIRELLGNGTLFGFPEGGVIPPITIFVLPAGGFFVFGMLIWLTDRLAERLDANAPKDKPAGCAACPNSAICQSAVPEGPAGSDNQEIRLETSSAGKGGGLS